MFSDAFEIHDDRFRSLILPNVHVEALWTGGRWLEGPVYVAAGRYLLFSDIPNDRLMRWDETDNSVSLFESPCGFQNGHTLDREGRLVACEHGSRRVSRVEHDGSTAVLASHFQGKRLNSPNDVVVKSDGSIWFTDPTYGIDSDYEGHRSPSEVGSSNVYRVDPADGRVSIVADGLVKPNGLAFNHDESKLYIVDSGATHSPDGPRHIREFDVAPDGRTLDSDRVLATCDQGIYDGMRLDEKGNIWVGAGDGVHCLSSEGELLGKIRIPETTANVVFGGAKRNRLFICATRSLYAVFLQTRAMARPTAT
jgi:gluconolactonase